MADFRPHRDATPSPSTLDFEQAAASHIEKLRAERHALGLSYSTVNEHGRVVHVHPDGSVRQSRDPASPIAG